ncbi:DUF447 domain-containing protein [Halobellus salinus]|uniref:DUF447 domain-containing protein n=1 Tax=Halobellus salinus TaxID=931585 RepID=UPI001E2B9F83|nr:DUF447 domain-containing protein [Halobellus salinus]
MVTTLGPNDLWNLAALGLHAPTGAGDATHGDATHGDATHGDATHGDPVTATTWGNTRTRRNFHRRGGGVIQFVSDPRTFVDAALTIREFEAPVLPDAHAWVEVRAEQVDAGEDGGTRWETWRLHPVAAAAPEPAVPRINRGFAATIEATVAASRLDVPAYDTDDLLARLRWLADVVDRCGGRPEREAFATLDTETAWRDRLDDATDVVRFDR